MKSGHSKRGRRIVLCVIGCVFVGTSCLFSQEERKRVTGRVTDEKGELMVGVAVTEEHTAPVNGVVTDMDGNYIISVASNNSVLKFSYLGYEEKEIRVGSEKVIDVVLKESTTELNEVVAVAFGKQKKNSVVGAISTVSVKELKAPTSNLTTTLGGRIAGVISYQRSGEPGEDNADFFIRGVTTFGAGKVNPLILIDGIEVGRTELARLRPDDIESFSVMKDATSTALYGARGANGVILVTTRSGEEGKVQVFLRAENSISAPTKNVKFADGVTYMNMYNEALLARDPFAVPYYSREKILSTAEGINPIVYPNNDWKKMLFKDYTMNQRYDLNVKGGGKIARYYVSGSFSQDHGILKVDKRNNFNSNIDLKSYTLRANMNINLTRTSELVVRLNGLFDDYTGPLDGGSEMYRKIVNANPVDFPAFFPPDEAHAHVRHIMFGGISTRSFINPYADMVKGYRNYDRSRMSAQMEFNQDLSFITSGLKFRGMFNINRTSRYDTQRSYNPYYYEVNYYDRTNNTYTYHNFNESGGTEYLDFNIPGESRLQSSSVYIQAIADYNRTFGKKHTVGAMLVYLQNEIKDASPTSLQLSLPSRNMGLSGRLTYGYDDRYFAEFNFGYNGSERFDKNHRFGFFPSGGIAWTVSNEKFWERYVKVINNLKVRATYGLVGNDQIGDLKDRFFYLSEVDMNASRMGSTFGKEGGYSRRGILITRYANPNITWEKARKLNVAASIGLFNELDIEAEYFREIRTNILMSRVSVPSTMGLAAPIKANVGEAEGYGFEFSADYHHFFKNKIWVQGKANFTYATGKYRKYEEPVYEKEWWKSKVGYPINQPYGYLAERLFVDDNEVKNSPAQVFGTEAIAGDIKFKDINGDHQITELDIVPLGYPTVPEIQYGFGTSCGYKNIDVSVFFQGVARESFWIDREAIAPFYNGHQVLQVIADDYYSTENPDLYAFWPRLSTFNHKNNLQRSSWWLRDGSFLRLKQAEIGYTFPQGMTRNFLRGGSLRIYVSGTNLLLWSKFKLWDVEMGGNGLGYPVQRVFNVGINVNI